MSESEANRLLSDLAENPGLNDTLLSMQESPKKIYELLTDLGYSATPHEIREAIIEQMMDKLTPAQLQSLAAGLSNDSRGTISAFGGTAHFGKMFDISGGAAAAV